MIKVAGKFALSLFTLVGLVATPFHAEAQPARTQRILFLGDSITDGLGVLREQAFPALIQAKITEFGWPFAVVNAGLSGDTSASGRRRVGWLLKQPVDLFVLELGGNDGLRGIDPAETKRNLAAILDAVKTKNPGASIFLAGMQLPPNLSQEYLRKFIAIYPALAQEKDAILVPEFLTGVGGIEKFNMEDQIHPNAEGHRILAETLWKALEPELRRRMP